MKLCKDCEMERGTVAPPLKPRPAPYPGPRCYTHHKARQRAVKDREHGRRIETTYGITADDYAALYGFQNGTCFICRRATGKTRKLSVDHDHETGEVRGLLCRPCNNMLGHARDSLEFVNRFREYLQYPPYRRMKDTAP